MYLEICLDHMAAPASSFNQIKELSMALPNLLSEPFNFWREKSQFI